MSGLGGTSSTSDMSGAVSGGPGRRGVGRDKERGREFVPGDGVPEGLEVQDGRNQHLRTAPPSRNLLLGTGSRGSVRGEDSEEESFPFAVNAVRQWKVQWQEREGSEEEGHRTTPCSAIPARSSRWADRPARNPARDHSR